MSLLWQGKLLLSLLGSGTLCRVKSAVIVTEYSLQLSIGLFLCPVHCGKTADRIWMHFGMVGQMGPWMRQVVVFGAREGVILMGNVAHPFVTNGEFAALQPLPNSLVFFVIIVIQFLKLLCNCLPLDFL